MADYPEWLRKLEEAWRGRIAKMFILHFNINDYVLPIYEWKDGSSLLELPCLMRPFLHLYLRDVLGFPTVYTYSLATGISEEDFRQMIVLPEGVMERQQFKPGQGQLPTSGQLEQYRRLVGEQRGEGRIENDLRVLDRILRGRDEQPNSPASATASTAAGQPSRAAVGSGAATELPKVAVIIDYVERIAPADAERGTVREYSVAIETLLRWAQDPYIRFKTNHIILMLTDNLEQVAQSLWRAGSGCLAIRVDRPGRKERLNFLQAMAARRVGRSELAPLADDLLRDADKALPTEAERQDAQLTNLASLSDGLNLVDLDNLHRRVRVRNLDVEDKSKTKLGVGHVREIKREVIEAQSRGLIEVCDPINRFADVGGLQHIKNYLVVQCDRLREESPETHRGIVLVGPPGTGKSIIAEALAAESGVNLVKMREIRSMWVGESERNLALALNLIESMHPVVVFVDEVDQALGSRDVVGGDAGTSARMFGRILEFMGSNQYRGKVFWVAASNRPDLLDAALLRRFDMVIPLLLPGRDECCQIFQVMPRVIRNRDEDQRTTGEFYATEICLVERGPADSKGGLALCTKPDCIADRAVQQGLTGADIEKIVRRARDIARERVGSGGGQATVRMPDLEAAFDDYKPNHDVQEYILQSLIALNCANFYSMMPRERAEAGKRAKLCLPPSLRPLVIEHEDGSKEPLSLFTDEGEERLDPARLQYAIRALKVRRAVSRFMG